MSIDQIETSEDTAKGLLVTDAAVEKVLEARSEEDEPEKLGLRVQIIGINGPEFSYDLSFESIDEALDNVVGIVGVAHGIAGTKKHLKKNVWYLLAQSCQTLPRTLLQESHCGIKGCTAPHLERKEAIRKPGVSVSNGDHVIASHSSC